MHTVARLAPTVSRFLLGAVFLIFGLNGFLQFIPQPVPPPHAGAFLGALAATGYMFPLIKGVEVVAGAMLLSNRFVPLALALLAPNVVNIVLFHAVLAPAGLPVALMVLGLEAFTAWTYREAYASMLKSQTAPTIPAAGARHIPAHAAS
ncbi:MAG TPA: DoxX family protein [Polyangiaceae bacterium]|jgi:hypothetical protein